MPTVQSPAGLCLLLWRYCMADHLSFQAVILLVVHAEIFIQTTSTTTPVYRPRFQLNLGKLVPER